MTVADTARAAAVHFEAKKTGFGQAQDGWSLTLRIQDADVPGSVRDARKGTRYMVALVEVGDDELPVAGSSNGKTPDFGSGNEGSTSSPAAKRRFNDMSRGQQAGVLYNDGRFQDWLDEHHGNAWSPIWEPDGGPYWTRSAVAAEIVREVCGVQSRARLDNETGPAEAWERLVAEYRRSQPVDDDQLPERR